ncbi:MAG: ABC transporter ATP-binding protein [Novosphingobium sp.]|jgi:lipopolysaccharide transport system ATP-binding protein|uniref:ABC transporter ATP-binding protein n=1 Tax=Novosphingobium sp. TaxID=1874826 RepID=UPI0022BCD586|nr:ABC transporter ATP-binding protein [Novosphingobium sp.]MCZ8035995.1 ABC transporter ATP-binding protein [Novosphingobium sp.]
MSQERPLGDMSIRIAGLNKSYRVWSNARDMLAEAFLGRSRHTELHALRDVTFEVPRGSVVGIMGRNGAGKSTLLRIVAGTLDATSGSVETYGRISAILELGTGFHPEYTGRENVFLGCLCLGLKRREITERFDDIVSFAELWDFIDRPFRTYSSGMQARLTFAVATCVDPDILIVDEALGVGDARFQLKSFARIRDFKRRGKSILLVSHNMNQLVSVCDHAVLLDAGRVIDQGDPNLVAKRYHEMLFSEPALAEADPPGDDTPREEAAGGREHRYGRRLAEFRAIRLLNAEGRVAKSLETLATYRFVCTVRARERIDDLVFGFHVRDVSGRELYAWDTLTGSLPTVDPLESGEERDIAVSFRTNLAAGSYFITVSLARLDGTKEDVRFDCYELVVAPTPHLFHASVVNLEVEFHQRADAAQ